MSEPLGERYRALYQNCHGDAAVATKRGISALDAVTRMKAVVAAASFDREVDVGAGEGAADSRRPRPEKRIEQLLTRGQSVQGWQ
jgi:hypothetical protein